jgi:hypothetical protein
VSYPRRQQLRRLMGAVRLAAGAMIASIGAVLVARAGFAGIAVSLAAAALVLVLLSRRALRLAGRSRVGAESERQVRGRARTARARGLACRARGRLAGPRGPRPRAALPLGNMLSDRDEDVALQPRTRVADGRRGALARARATALSVRGAACRVRHPRSADRAVRGGSARCFARLPDDRAAPGTVPLAVMVDSTIA